MVTKIKPYRIRDVNEPEEGNSLQYNDPNTFARGEGGGGGAYIAGENIQIDGNVISATDTIYNAGEGIEIGSKTYIDTQGPCPDGFHVPTASQWSDIVNNLNGLVWNKSSCENLLKLPSAGSLSSSGTPGSISNLSYWSSSHNGVDSACELVATASGIYEPVNNGQYRACGLPIRPFKDTPVIPDDSWVQLSSGRIYRNESLGIISIRLNPFASNRWITIADKNLGATTVYNVGDEKSESNCGKYYQWGNNYGFERNVTPAKTSAIAVDASSYGPRNYYYSDTFITVSPDRSSVRNDNLRGGVTGVVTLDNVISNTGVLSVNGETGHVTVESGGKQSFFKTQDEYDALPASKESDGNLYIIVDNHLNLLTPPELYALGVAAGDSDDAIISELNTHPAEYFEFAINNGRGQKTDFPGVPAGKKLYTGEVWIMDDPNGGGVYTALITDMEENEFITYILNNAQGATQEAAEQLWGKRNTYTMKFSAFPK